MKALKFWILVLVIGLFVTQLKAQDATQDKDQQVDLLRIALERSRQQNTRCEEDFANLGSNFNKIMKQLRDTSKELEDLKKTTTPTEKKAE